MKKLFENFPSWEDMRLPALEGEELEVEQEEEQEDTPSLLKFLLSNRQYEIALCVSSVEKPTRVSVIYAQAHCY